MTDPASPLTPPAGPAAVDRWPPLAGIAFSRSALPRAADHRRDEVFLAAAWADPATRVVLVHRGRAPVQSGPQGTALCLVPPDRVPQWQTVPRCLLGVDHAGVAYFSARPDHDADAPDGSRWAGLREVGADLGDLDAEVMATAVALDQWHDTHAHCPRCGTPTEVVQAGWVRRCAADGSEHFPRADPVVIVLVRDGQDRALLGRQARWPEGWFSTLAGYVEPGESAEAAVRREVAEESGVQVGDVAYLGSQPWPFPGSLMIGFHAWAAGPGAHPITVDGVEITQADWFSRDELRAACDAGRLFLPPPVSIARRLIERWYGQALPATWSRLIAPAR